MLTNPVLTLLSLLSLCTFLLSIRTGDELMDALCNQQFKQDTVLTLNHSLSYTLNQTKTCISSINGTLSIKSDVTERSVSVSCFSQDLSNPHSNVAFGFMNTEVSIENVVFHGCGSFLTHFDTKLVNLINSSRLPFTENHSALFVFFNCSIHFFEVIISNYFGFAIIGVDLQNSVFNSVNVSTSLAFAATGRNRVSIGSGILLLFVNPFQSQPNILFFNCNFNKNLDWQNSSCIDALMLEKSHHIHNAAALTIMFSQNQTNEAMVLVEIKQTCFYRNIGSYSSGILILMHNTTKSKVKISENSVFIKNSNHFFCPGSAITFYIEEETKPATTLSPLEIINVSFIQQGGVQELVPHHQGAVYISVANFNGFLDFPFTDILFQENFAEKFAACILVVAPTVSNNLKTRVTLEKIKVFNNSLKDALRSNAGMFVFENINEVIINGTSTNPSIFSNNIGSVIQTHHSNVYLNGYAIFSNNAAKFGSSFNMKASVLYFNEKVDIEFSNNSANVFGGVINIENRFMGISPYCALQLASKQNYVIGGNNAVVSGNFIYGTPLYGCYATKINGLVNNSRYYYEGFSLSNSTSNGLLDISSMPRSYHYCFSSYESTARLFPGKTVHLPFSAHDYFGNAVYSLVEVSVETSNNRREFNNPDFSISNLEKYQVLNERKKRSCSLVKITILCHRWENEIGDTFDAVVHISNLDSSLMSSVMLEMFQCPIGFELDEHGMCNCSSAVKAFFNVIKFDGECNINKLTISYPIYFTMMWLGKCSQITNKTKCFAITGICPIDYCSSVFGYSKSMLNVSSELYMIVKTSNTSRTDTLCRPHRRGVLCGECEEGYSVVFGSGDCKKCSNWWLLTILLYAIAGPLLIFFMYTFRLTLAHGTINGIIFYAQAANVNILPFINLFPQNSLALTKFVVIFLSLLNLNLGFPLCFYDGMDELSKSGLGLAFPVYLLLIVTMVILMSRYSSWLSNKTSKFSVQVLVTIVHLSFSNLLIAIINIVKPVQIYMDDGGKAKEHMVWYRNGNIDFGSHKHILLIAVTSSIVSIFFIPYLCILIGGRYVIQTSFGAKYLRAAYEAIHGPYEENKKYWFTLRLFLLIAMFLLFSSGISYLLYVLITLLLLSTFLFFQLHFRPFKKMFINVLDSTITFNLIMLYLIGWYADVTVAEANSSLWVSYTVVVILQIIFFIKFVFAVMYHSFFFVELKHPLVLAILGCVENQIKKMPLFYHDSKRSRKSSLFLYDASSSSSIGFREPLLADSD